MLKNKYLNCQHYPIYQKYLDTLQNIIDYFFELFDKITISVMFFWKQTVRAQINSTRICITGVK